MTSAKEEGFDDELALTGVAQRIAHDYGIAVLFGIADGGAGLGVSEDGVSIVQPGGVCGIAVVGDELFDSGKKTRCEVVAVVRVPAS